MTLKPRLFPSNRNLTNDIQNALRPDRSIPALLAGTLTGILQIALSISFAALIFRGEMAADLPRGIGMALFSATIGMGLTSLLTSCSAILGGNQSAPAAIMGVMAAGIAGIATGGETRLATVAVAVALTTLITGASLYGLGAFRLAGLARFLPYPVAGGFLAGTGWLLVVGGIGTMAHRAFSFAGLPALFDPNTLILWLPGLILGAAILILAARIRHYFLMPAVLIAIIIGFYLITRLAGLSASELSADGWLLGPFPTGGLWQPISIAELSVVDWRAIWPQLPHLISAVVITTIALLLNATGLELAINRDIDLNREMRVAGVTNMAAGVGAGLVGYLQLGTSTLNERMGAASRLTGFTAAAISGVTLWMGGAVLGFVPTVVFGSLLIYLGLSLLWEWLVVAWKRLPTVDYLIVLLILAVIATAGFLEGVLVGILATVILFVVSYSRTSVVKHTLTGASFKSRVTRSPEDRALLEAIGDQAYLLQLQGFIFFGTANSLLDKVRDRVRDVPTRYVVIDFRQVIGLDSTALLSFNKMVQTARAGNFTLVFSGLSGKLQTRFEQGGLREEAGVVRYAHDLDHAAEWCEDQLCANQQDDSARKSLLNYLMAIAPQPATERLIGYMEREVLDAGEHLIRQGTEPDHLFFLESGQLTARLESPNQPPVRLETMQGGHAVGELGFYMGTRRSAAVVVDRPSVIYTMSKTTLDRLEKEDPEAAYVFHRIIIHVLGERVLHLVRAIDALQG